MLFLAASPVTSEDLIWPIDAPPSVSSSFGEPRPGRFHFGVDVRTGGVTGKKVYALGDGYISRIKTTPFGYGKVLYLTLDSGESIVYAHLSGFLPEIEDILFKNRIERKSYDVELLAKPCEFRVSKGQIIAYSGDTGSGPAHLHFELRDNANTPLNPLDHGFNVKDTIPPVLGNIVLIPLDFKSTIDGYPMARMFDRESLKSATPILSGRIGVAVSVEDRINNSTSRLGVYSLQLVVDSTAVFSKKYAEISYDLNGIGGLDYLSGYDYGENGYLSVLFKREGNSADFYDGDGILNCNTAGSMDKHEVSITAKDHADNTAFYTFPVIFGQRPAFSTCGFIDGKTVRFTGEHLSGTLSRIELWRLNHNKSWTCDRIIPLQQSRFDIRETVVDVSKATYKAVLVAEDSTRSVPCVFRLDPEHAATVGDAVITVQPELFHDKILVRINAPFPLASLPIVTIEKNGVVADGFISAVPENDTSWVASIPLLMGSQFTRMRIKASALDQNLKAVWTIVPMEYTMAGIQRSINIVAPDSLFSLSVEPKNLYRPAPVTVDTTVIRNTNGLKRVSRGYKVTWGDTPLKGSHRVSLTLEHEPPSGSALFKSVNGNGWGFLSAEHDSTTFTGAIGSSAQIAVLSDTVEPYVMPISPKSGSTIRSDRPLLKAYVEDKDSGIGGSDSISMTIDGIPAYAEYDYEAHTVEYILRNPLAEGAHTVIVSVTDRVGNTRTRSWKFTVKK